MIYILLIGILITLMMFLNKLDSDSAKLRVKYEKEEQEEMHRLDLTKTEYSNYKLKRKNSENLLNKSLKEFNVPDIIFLQITSANAPTIISYDSKNKIQYWNTYILLPILFNCKIIVVDKSVDFLNLIRLLNYDGDFLEYSYTDNLSFVTNIFEQKTFSLYTALSKTGEEKKSYMSLAEEYLDPNLLKEINIDLTYHSNSVKRIERWLDKKVESGEATLGAGNWAFDKIDQISDNKNKIMLQNNARNAYFLFEKKYLNTKFK